jgi:hypothetical protein
LRADGTFDNKSAATSAARRRGLGDVASVAEGATMSDAFGVAELVDICRESERRGDAAATSTSNTDEEREPQC